MKKLIAFLASALSLTATAQAATVEMSPPQMSSEARAWQMALDAGTHHALVKFVLEHPESRHVEDARQRLLSLAATAPARPAAPAVLLRAPDLSADVFQHI